MKKHKQDQTNQNKTPKTKLKTPKQQTNTNEIKQT